MKSVTLLEPPVYTGEEQKALIDFVCDLKITNVQEFLKQVNLPVSGTKPELRSRIQEGLEAGEITYEQIVAFLDSVAPWGKQHVFLYAGPQNNIASWKNPDYVRELLKRHNMEELFNARLPLILPDRLALSSITHSNGKLRVTAIQKQVYQERAKELDEEKETEIGTPITLRAYTNHLSRALVAFEWDLNANAAMLQITQLHRDTLYEEVAKEFWGLVSGWLDISKFGLVDIRRAIKRLHELEEVGTGETRSHGIHYQTRGGSSLSALSPSPRDSMLHDKDVNNAMHTMTKTGVGNLGNFYWLPNIQPGPVSNPLGGDVHVYIVGKKSRINFPTPNNEEVVRYVLYRVRQLS